MSELRGFLTNLELRESNPDGTEGAGLSHSTEGLFLLHVLELAAEGEPQGCVTVVHDAGDHGGRYQELAGELADAGWAVALPDMRGHGKSEGERGHCWGMPEPVRDIESVRDHLAYRMPEAPKMFVGIGLGALYCMAYAQAFPDHVSGMVLLGPWLSPNGTPPPKPKGLRAMFAKPKPTDAGSLGIAPESWTSDAAQAAARRADSLVHDAITRHALDRLPAEAAGVLAKARTISAPTLILHGSEDRLAPIEAARGLVGGSLELREIAGSGHDLLHDVKAAEVRAAIIEFFDRLG